MSNNYDLYLKGLFKDVIKASINEAEARESLYDIEDDIKANGEEHTKTIWKEGLKFTDEKMSEVVEHITSLRKRYHARWE